MIGSLGRLVASGFLVAALAACGGSTKTQSLDDARSAIAKGDMAAAAIILKSFLQQSPGSLEARLLFGKLLLDSGDARTAEVELRKAQELTAKPDDYAPMLAKALLANDKPKQVIAEFSGLQLDQPKLQADLIAVVAQAYVQLDQRERASKLIDEALAMAPDSVGATVVKARLLAGQGEVTEALQALDRLGSASDPDLARLRADLVLLNGNRAEALKLYRKLIEQYPRDLYGRGQIIAIHLLERDLPAARSQLAAAQKLYPTHPQVNYLAASIALQAGDYQQARELSLKLLSQVRDNPRVLLLAGEAALRLNSLTQAEAHLSKLVALVPQTTHGRRLLAIIHMRKGQPALALEVLRPALEAKNKDTETLMLAAEAHLLSGDSKAAEPFFRQIATREPENVRARTALALARLSEGDPRTAIADLQAIAAKDKGVLADLVLTDVRLRQRDLQGALRAIDLLEQKQADRALPPHLRGSILAQMRNRVEARRNFETALKRDPQFFPSVKALADLDLAELKPESARLRYESLLKTDPKQSQALVELAAMAVRQGGPAPEVAQLLSRAIESRPTEASYRVMLVNHWITHGDPRQALSMAQAALVAIPDDPSLLDALGRAQLANNEVTQSLATFARIAANDPKSPFPQLRLADAHQRAGNQAAAEAALRKALEIAPNFLPAQRGLVQMAMRARDNTRALQIARLVQSQRPQEADGHLLEADIHAGAKQWDAAANALRAGMSKSNGSLAAVRLHILLSAHPRVGDAAKHADDWMRQHPKDTLFKSHAGLVAMESGNHAEAERLYRQVIQLDPGDAVATNNLAWLMASAKKPGAVSMAEEAVRLAPHKASVLDTLAFALAQEGQLERAIAVSQSAVRMQPDLAPARLTLARLYLQGNDKKAARTELELLSKLGERFSSHREVRALLGSL